MTPATPLVPVLVLALSLAAPQAQVLFRDITKEAGITFQHHAAPERNTSSSP